MVTSLTACSYLVEVGVWWSSDTGWSWSSSRRSDRPVSSRRRRRTDRTRRGRPPASAPAAHTPSKEVVQRQAVYRSRRPPMTACCRYDPSNCHNCHPVLTLTLRANGPETTEWGPYSLWRSEVATSLASDVPDLGLPVAPGDDGNRQANREQCQHKKSHHSSCIERTHLPASAPQVVGRLASFVRLGTAPARSRALEPELPALLGRQAVHAGPAALESATAPQGDGGGILAGRLGHALDVFDDRPRHLVEVALLAERDHLALGSRTLWHATIVAERSGGR